MATVFMKWLETKPSDYDRGIELLTLGRIKNIRRHIANQIVHADGAPRPRVLEIGCGTGTLTVMLGERGAQLTAIDFSPSMLQEAKHKVADKGLDDRVELLQLDVSQLENYFPPKSFNFVISSLVFSELPTETQKYTLREISSLLKPGGSLLLADETLPEGIITRLIYWALRIPLVILTWLLTRTTTTPLNNLTHLLDTAGFVPKTKMSYLAGSLQLIEAKPILNPQLAGTLWQSYSQLKHRVNLKTILLDLCSYFFRIMPPYVKVSTGLYRIGHPDQKSPVLATGNYDLTVRRLVKQLDGKVNCWLLVANSRGINVWCSAGGGHFTAEDIISALNTSGVKEVVSHHALILPQLCANGVNGWKIRRDTGWGIHWGPVRASDVPAYLKNGRKKTDDMRQVRFLLRDRLEMTTVMVLFYGFFAILLGLFFWREDIWTVLAAMVVISFIYGIFHSWIPGRDGLEKGISLAVLTLLTLWGWSFVWGHIPFEELFNWSLALGFLAFFIGAEYQGMSPLLRGEQSNWAIEGLVGLGVLLAYGASRLFF